EDGIRDRNVTGVQTCALPIFQPFRRVVKGIRIIRCPWINTGKWIPKYPALTQSRDAHLAPWSGEKAMCPGRIAKAAHDLAGVGRSEERRVGKEGRAGGSGDG